MSGKVGIHADEDPNHKGKTEVIPVRESEGAG
jgi:hypothetical protein